MQYTETEPYHSYRVSGPRGSSAGPLRCVGLRTGLVVRVGPVDQCQAQINSLWRSSSDPEIKLVVTCGQTSFSLCSYCDVKF